MDALQKYYEVGLKYVKQHGKIYYVLPKYADSPMKLSQMIYGFHFLRTPEEVLLNFRSVGSLRCWPGVEMCRYLNSFKNLKDVSVRTERLQFAKLAAPKKGSSEIVFCDCAECEGFAVQVERWKCLMCSNELHFECALKICDPYHYPSFCSEACSFNNVQLSYENVIEKLLAKVMATPQKMYVYSSEKRQAISIRLKLLWLQRNDIDNETSGAEHHGENSIPRLLLVQQMKNGKPYSTRSGQGMLQAVDSKYLGQSNKFPSYQVPAYCLSNSASEEECAQTANHPTLLAKTVELTRLERTIQNSANVTLYKLWKKLRPFISCNLTVEQVNSIVRFLQRHDHRGLNMSLTLCIILVANIGDSKKMDLISTRIKCLTLRGTVEEIFEYAWDEMHDMKGLQILSSTETSMVSKYPVSASKLKQNGTQRAVQPMHVEYKQAHDMYSDIVACPDTIHSTDLAVSTQNAYAEANKSSALLTNADTSGDNDIQTTSSSNEESYHTIENDQATIEVFSDSDHTSTDHHDPSLAAASNDEANDRYWHVEEPNSSVRKRSLSESISLQDRLQSLRTQSGNKATEKEKSAWPTKSKKLPAEYLSNVKDSKITLASKLSDDSKSTLQAEEHRKLAWKASLERKYMSSTLCKIKGIVSQDERPKSATMPSAKKHKVSTMVKVPNKRPTPTAPVREKASGIMSHKKKVRVASKLKQRALEASRIGSNKIVSTKSVFVIPKKTAAEHRKDAFLPPDVLINTSNCTKIGTSKPNKKQETISKAESKAAKLDRIIDRLRKNDHKVHGSAKTQSELNRASKPFFEDPKEVTLGDEQTSVVKKLQKGSVNDQNQPANSKQTTRKNKTKEACGLSKILIENDIIHRNHSNTEAMLPRKESLEWPKISRKTASQKPRHIRTCSIEEDVVMQKDLEEEVLLDKKKTKHFSNDTATMIQKKKVQDTIIKPQLSDDSLILRYHQLVENKSKKIPEPQSITPLEEALHGNSNMAIATRTTPNCVKPPRTTKTNRSRLKGCRCHDVTGDLILRTRCMPKEFKRLKPNINVFKFGNIRIEVICGAVYLHTNCDHYLFKVTQMVANERAKRRPRCTWFEKLSFVLNTANKV